MVPLEGIVGEHLIKNRPVELAADAARKAWRRARSMGPLVREPRIAALKYTSLMKCDGGRPMVMLYIGDAERAAEFASFAGADAHQDVPAPKELFRGNLASYMLHRARLERMTATVDVAVRQLFPLERPPSDAFVHHPFVDGYLDVARDLTQQLRRVRSRSYRRLLRAQLREGRFSVDVQNDRDALVRFYNELHEPYVRTRFGKRVVLDSLEDMLSLFQAGGRVLFVKDRDQVVAGTVLLHDFAGPGILTYHRNGIRDPASTALVTHRTALLELSLLRYAIDNGFRRIDLGFTRAIANEGRFVHKRRLGCTFEPVLGAPTVAIHCERAVRPMFFARFALLTGETGALTMHLGLDGSAPQLRPQALRQALKGYLAPGVTNIHVHASPTRDPAERASYEKVVREVAAERDVFFDEV